MKLWVGIFIVSGFTRPNTKLYTDLNLVNPEFWSYQPLPVVRMFKTWKLLWYSFLRWFSSTLSISTIVSRKASKKASSWLKLRVALAVEVKMRHCKISLKFPPESLTLFRWFGMKLLVPSETRSKTRLPSWPLIQWQQRVYWLQDSQ